MTSRYESVVQFLESLQIMPKSMPGLHKIQNALWQTDWFKNIDPEKVIVVAGTNGKGSTCAMLESLLLNCNQKVGFYSSPHLVTTTERIRINGESISEENFIKIFEQCESLIRSCELSHFEALTLMAGYCYFSDTWNLQLDYIIFEVGLGGTYDATNAFPHRYSVITPIDIDHANILGKTLAEIAPNKFGIIHTHNIVIHQKLNSELAIIKDEVLKKTQSRGIEVEKFELEVSKSSATPQFLLRTKWGHVALSMLGARAGENASTALSVFAALGFDPALHLKALSSVNWRGRMQKIEWPGMACPVYLSGDHNVHGLKSLIEILNHFTWKTIHVMVGIGADKEAGAMLAELCVLSRLKLYLTETPFKGLRVDQYPSEPLQFATLKDEKPIQLLRQIAESAGENDLVVVTGSLYLVGEILKMTVH